MFLRKNLPLKIFCLLLSIALWAMVKYTQSPWILKNSYQTTLNIPIEYQYKPKELTLVNSVTFVTVSVKGSSDLIDSLTPSRFKASVNLRDLQEGSSWVDLDFHSPPGITVTDINPSKINVTLEEKVSKKMPISLRIEGKINQGYELLEHSYTPLEAEVSGLRSQVDSITQLSVRVNLAGLISSTKELVPIIPINVKNEAVELAVLPKKAEVFLDIAADNRFRNIPVIPTFKGSPLRGFTVVNSDWEPNSVAIRVLKPSKENLKFLKTHPVNLNNLTKNEVFEVKVLSPSNVMLLDKDTIKVKVFVKRERGK